MDYEMMETISEINYFGEDRDVPFTDMEKRTEWLVSVMESYDKELGELNYIFCSDDYILEVNNKYLNHDYFTDVITFDYCENNTISGDIYISVDMIAFNAEKFGKSQENELYRVMAHGLLHLCGLKDKSDEEAQAMRDGEDEALKMIFA